MVQDFAKNRDIENQEEIKAQYWQKRQVTMHPTVLFYRLEEKGEVHRLVITHLSDITVHDAHLVHYITLDCISILKEKHPLIEWTKFFVWSDGCAAQYKGNNSFYYLDKFHDGVDGVHVERNFFASEHGKGPSDAETGLYAMQLNVAIRSRKVVIQNASEMCDFLQKNNDESEEKKHVERKFRLVKKDDYLHLKEKFQGVEVSTLAGNCTRSLHQIKPTEEKKVLMQRPFSCFCTWCRAGNFAACIFSDFTKGEFMKQKLKTNEKEIENEEENEEDIEINEFENEVDLEAEEEIQIEHQNIQFDDLKSNDFVIVAVPFQKKKKNRKCCYHVAKIVDLQGEHDIGINYYKQDTYHHEKFIDDSQGIDFTYFSHIDDIVMLLPIPEPIRNGIVFPRKINLDM